MKKTLAFALTFAFVLVSVAAFAGSQPTTTTTAAPVAAAAKTAAPAAAAKTIDTAKPATEAAKVAVEKKDVNVEARDICTKKGLAGNLLDECIKTELGKLQAKSK